MKTYSLELFFLNDRKSELPLGPMAQVYVKSYGRTTQDGPLTITPECVTIGEFDHQIDRLKDELEAIRKKARARFLADLARQR